MKSVTTAIIVAAATSVGAHAQTASVAVDPADGSVFLTLEEGLIGASIVSQLNLLDINAVNTETALGAPSQTGPEAVAFSKHHRAPRRNLQRRATGRRGALPRRLGQLRRLFFRPRRLGIHSRRPRARTRQPRPAGPRWNRPVGPPSQRLSAATKTTRKPTNDRRKRRSFFYAPLLSLSLSLNLSLSLSLGFSDPPEPA